jgi:hypothetical protein
MDMKHRIVICTMQDVAITQEGVMELTRQGIYHCWAYIKPVRLSMYSVLGFSIQDDRSERTHEMLIRNRRDLDFSSAAWAYEQRLKTGDRWYKLLRYSVYEEDGEYLYFDARLVEHGDTMTKPVPVAEQNKLEPLPLPKGFKL